MVTTESERTRAFVFRPPGTDEAVENRLRTKRSLEEDEEQKPPPAKRRPNPAVTEPERDQNGSKRRAPYTTGEEDDESGTRTRTDRNAPAETTKRQKLIPLGEDEQAAPGEDEEDDPFADLRLDTDDDGKDEDGADGPTVRLNPLIKLVDGKINRIAISSLQRTPSPFTGRMGDHTVAWASVVDSVRARLDGRTVRQASAELRQAHDEAAGWLHDSGSVGNELMNLLGPDDKAKRRPVLAHWAKEVELQLKLAETAGTPEERTWALQQAVAHHLAFVNYLPFATVRAASDRGSKGSGEGTKRGRILDNEVLTDVDGARPIRDKAKARGLRDDLWGLFDFRAALRESDAELMLDPSIMADAKTHYDKLTALHARLSTVLGNHGNGISSGLEAASIQAAADTLRAQLKDNPHYDALSRFAGSISTLAASAHEATQSSYKSRIRTDAKRGVPVLERALNTAKTEYEDLSARAKDAPKRAGLVLARLLREHQQTVATAYPKTVIETRFLGTSPMQAALDKLQELLPDETTKTGTAKRTSAALSKEQTPSEQLLAEIGRQYPRFGAEPKAGTQNDWVLTATVDDLVVSYNPKAAAPLQIAGRPAAPTGITGMGAHTTAWVDETAAVNALIAGRTPPQALAALHQEMRKDLRSRVMKLDQWLPADQLAGGQLVEIFTKADEVLRAKDVAEAARSYLGFRNLLPYATVAVADTTGHGERANRLKINFDAKALAEAASMQSDALNDKDEREEARASMNQAAEELRKAKNELTADPDLRKQIDASITRLKKQRVALAGSQPPGLTKIAGIITGARRAEHRRVTGK